MNQFFGNINSSGESPISSALLTKLNSVSDTQWGYLSTMDQPVNTTATPSFPRGVKTSSITSSYDSLTVLFNSASGFNFARDTAAGEALLSTGYDKLKICRLDKGMLPEILLRASTTTLQGSLRLQSGSYYTSTASYLTANRTLSLPDKDVNLANVPNQNVDTGAAPSFSSLSTNSGATSHWILKSLTDELMWNIGLSDTSALTIGRFSSAKR
ncbi:MAG TPA: hypothetical protein V6C97_20905 [Oculatellaceae cyanobacterium]